MTQTAFGIPPFSAEIGLWLECEEGRFPLAQTGPDFIIAADARTLPPDYRASIVVSVDGQEHSRPVVLVMGMSADEPMTPIRCINDDTAPF